MKVSLVATVKDAAPEIEEFLISLEAQTRSPDEVVIVDGGSTDGTVEALRRVPSITLIEEPGANIARGRNLAVRAASHEIIACTDADCVLAPDWLERVVAPLEAGAEVAMGIYRPLARSFLETCAAAISIKERRELDPRTYMPSARSVAFLRDAFEEGGGYPEWLAIGEDMYLNRRWRSLGTRMELARDAVVYRRPRSGLRPYWRQFSAYAAGDGEAGMYPERHALRFAVYGALSLALASGRRWPALLAAAGGAAYAARPLSRAFGLLPSARERAAALVAVPALMALTDVAKMTGYLRGVALRRGRGSAGDGE